MKFSVLLVLFFIISTVAATLMVGSQSNNLKNGQVKLRFAYPYPNEKMMIFWHYYLVVDVNDDDFIEYKKSNFNKINALTHVMILPNSLYGWCQIDKLACCKNSLESIPYDSLTIDFSYKKWTFFIGIQDSGLNSLNVSKTLEDSNCWNEVLPNYAMIEF